MDSKYVVFLFDANQIDFMLKQETVNCWIKRTRYGYMEIWSQ